MWRGVLERWNLYVVVVVVVGERGGRGRVWRQSGEIDSLVGCGILASR